MHRCAGNSDRWLAPGPISFKAPTRPPGSVLLSDADAGARVRRSPREPRPGNRAANHAVPAAGELAAFRSRSRSQLPYADRVTACFQGTTDELIQWAAWKWGLDEDLVRAQAVQESRWHQGAVGDRGLSFGLMQIKRTAWRGSYPLSARSTAFNLDLYGAIVRYYFDGLATWLRREPGRGREYAAGDLWGALGAYFSGHWHTPEADLYALAVSAHLVARAWRRF